MGLEIIKPGKTNDFLSVAYEFGDDPPLKRILLATEAYGCKTIIKETQAEDEEYISEYDIFYKTVFNSKPPTEVVRLHFFEDLLNNVDQQTIDKAKNSYLGYCTLRPLHSRKVCDAFMDKRMIIDEDSRFVYLVCSMDKTIKLNNVELKISGFPYMQQDGRIAACAQTTVRIISQYMSWKNKGTEALTAPQVTEKVKDIPFPLSQPLRNIPTPGLNVSQIRAALGYLNCDPIIYDYTFVKKEALQIERPEQIIYRYLESGLPIIIGIDLEGGQGHAIVVVGHTFNPDFWWSEASRLYYNLPKTGQKRAENIVYHCSNSWIQNFIVQDDNLGPYYFVDTSFFKSWVSCIIVPLPKGVYLTAEEAELQAWSAVNKKSFVRILAEDVLIQLKENKAVVSNIEWLEMFLDFLQSGDLILRTYLRESEEFKSDINKFTRSSEVKKEYLELGMPKYVWVVELSWPDIFCHIRKKCGEIIIDSTAEANDFNSVLAIHLPGFFVKGGDSYQMKLILDDDQPFRHYYRKQKPLPRNLPLGEHA
jgi:hypothetical protein